MMILDPKADEMGAPDWWNESRRPTKWEPPTDDMRAADRRNGSLRQTKWEPPPDEMGAPKTKWEPTPIYFIFRRNIWINIFNKYLIFGLQALRRWVLGFKSIYSFFKNFFGGYIFCDISQMGIKKSDIIN